MSAKTEDGYDSTYVADTIFATSAKCDTSKLIIYQLFENVLRPSLKYKVYYDSHGKNVDGNSKVTNICEMGVQLITFYGGQLVRMTPSIAR